jgi:Ni,Fe-hydrogenase III large subunit/Ni,Fe-hydrogenase III component G
MHIPGSNIQFERWPAPLPMWHASVSPRDWQAAARTLTQSGGRLVSLWGTERRPDETGKVKELGYFVVCAAYAVAEGMFLLELPLPAGETVYPDLAVIIPAAARMQRAVADLLGIAPANAVDKRPWLNHGAWPANHFPLREEVSAQQVFPDREVTDYAFVPVQGDGVHEIPVGPVHAGTIEPGHFRFSVVGEKVLRLEQRLGYTHKGIEKRFTQLAPLQAHKLAGRVSGDSTVAYAWAYCMALESATGCEVPARALWLRALMLERERVANHLGDLGALGNDAALSFGLAQFSRLRENWLRVSAKAFGHRLMMDCVVPGGAAGDLDSITADALCRQCDDIEREVRLLRRIYDEHAGLQDRFLGTGQVTPELAVRLSLAGLAGRASGQARDLRCDHAWTPYDALQVKMVMQHNGDVAARVAVRFDETFESLRLIHAIVRGLPAGATRTEVQLPANAACGAGWVEGWRGEVFVALELEGETQQHRIRRCHCHDPSWQNWPVLEHAVIGNIVPDFPLINKSFNLSYSGQDL